MSYWFFFNCIVFIYASWQVLQHFSYQPTYTHILFGFLGLLFFLFNWTRHAVFSTIRTSSNRPAKIRWVNLSKVIRPYHRWIGTSALVMIIIHAVLIIQRYGIYWTSTKMLSGLFALTTLIAVVLSGWYRLVKPSGWIRRLHLRLGLLLFVLIVLHLWF